LLLLSVIIVRRRCWNDDDDGTLLIFVFEDERTQHKDDDDDDDAIIPCALLSLFSPFLSLSLLKRAFCVCIMYRVYSTNLSLEYLFFRLSFWANLEQNYPKKNEWLLTAFLFYLGFCKFCTFLQTSCRV